MRSQIEQLLRLCWPCASWERFGRCC